MPAQPVQGECRLKKRQDKITYLKEEYSNSVITAMMIHPLGCDNNLHTGFGDQMADVERPYEEWRDFVTKIALNLLSVQWNSVIKLVHIVS